MRPWGEGFDIGADEFILPADYWTPPTHARGASARHRKIGKRFGLSEPGVTRASRRIRIKMNGDKRLGKLISKIVKELTSSNAWVWPQPSVSLYKKDLTNSKNIRILPFKGKIIHAPNQTNIPYR
jgi:hypothetical protein